MPTFPDLADLQFSEKIVNEDGTPSDYLLRYLRDRGGFFTEAEAEIVSLLARQIIAGAGLTGGGDLTENRTLNVGAGTGITVNADDVALSDTAVTPGSYTNADITVDQQGRITAAANGTGGGGGYGYEAGPADTPLNANYTWWNQGSCTATDTTGALLLTNPGDASALVRGKYTTAPTAPYDVYLRADSIQNDSSGATVAVGDRFGILLRDGVNGDAIFLGSNGERISGDEQNFYALDILRITSAGAVSAQALVRYNRQRVKWLRANVTSTTITFYGSLDGLNWKTVGTETIATFVGAVTQIGFATRVNPASADTDFLFQQFGTTAPS